MYQYRDTTCATLQPERRETTVRQHYEVITDGLPGGRTTTYQLYIVTETSASSGKPHVRYDRLGSYSSFSEAERAARILAPPRRNGPTR